MNKTLFGIQLEDEWNFFYFWKIIITSPNKGFEFKVFIQIKIYSTVPINKSEQIVRPIILGTLHDF